MKIFKIFSSKYWPFNILGILCGTIIMFIFNFYCKCGWPGRCECGKHWMYYPGLVITIISSAHLLISLIFKIKNQNKAKIKIIKN